MEWSQHAQAAAVLRFPARTMQTQMILCMMLGWLVGGQCLHDECGVSTAWHPTLWHKAQHGSMRKYIGETMRKFYKVQRGPLHEVAIRLAKAHECRSHHMF